MRDDLSRRRLLQVALTTGITSLAGCPANSGDTAETATLTQSARDPTETVRGRTSTAAPAESRTRAGTEEETPIETETRTETPGECDEQWNAPEQWSVPVSDEIASLRWSEQRNRLLARTKSSLVTVTPAGTVVSKQSLPEGRTIAWDGTRMVLSGSDLEVFALSTRGLERRWTFDDGEWNKLLVTVGEGRVYVLSMLVTRPSNTVGYNDQYARLYALDAASGETLWQIDELPAGPSYDQCHATNGVIALQDENEVTIVSSEGTVRSTGELPSSVGDWGPVQDGTMYVGTVDDELYSIDLDEGTTTKRRDEVSYVLGSVGDHLLVTGGSEHVGVSVERLDPSTGERQWSWEYWASSPARESVLAGDTLYTEIGWPEGDRLHALDIETGCELGSFETAGGGRFVGPLVMANGQLYASVDKDRSGSAIHAITAARSTQ